MEDWILLKADLKRHKGSLAGVFILVLLVCAALCTVLSVWMNSGHYIRGEMERAGFGTLTAWVSQVPDMNGLAADIGDLREVDRVETQNLIYSDYIINGQESDSEGQLIPYGAEENRYRFFEDGLSGYRGDTPEILPGEIYVPPSMVTMFDVGIGDEIRFSVARGGRTADFTVKGFYEDPFMGSSMIGMKGFLINEGDYAGITQIIQDSGIDGLARNGAMLHIFQDGDSSVTVSQLNRRLNEDTKLPMYTEFLHSGSAIAGFMLILQNAFSGLLAAFVAVLFFVVLIVLGHNIGSAIEGDYVNMGILKTMGFTGNKLRRIQLAQYQAFILGGMLMGIAIAAPLSRLVSRATLTTTGIRIPAGLPAVWCFLCCFLVFMILTGFVILKTAKINRITPMKAIREEAFGSVRGTLGMGKYFPIQGTHLKFSMALRQLTAGARRYGGACIVAILLVFFASLIGRMDSWLGADGKGMMDAFNPADHHIGVQIFGDHSSKEAEDVMGSFTGIADRYLLAMMGVSVGGIDYTANVITDPERFHMIRGRTCMGDDEIVVTEFVASDLGVSIGDAVRVQADIGSETYVISGIYTCANDMGANIGMSREGYLKIGQDHPDIWCRHYFLEDASRKEAVTEALEEIYGGDVHVHENTWPGLYGIISAMEALLVFMYVMAAAFILIVTIMTGSKIVSAEQRDIGIYKAVGFTSGQLRGAFALRFTIIGAFGSLIGTALSAAFTDSLVSGVMKMAGISNFTSSMTAGNTLAPSAAVILMFTGFAYAASWKVKRVDLTVLITE
ncbi:MAG: FtsX-like permease family protein [Clostridium sp.]|nr:FtsX-like permease family protein [Clostridium sp.]